MAFAIAFSHISRFMHEILFKNINKKKKKTRKGIRVVLSPLLLLLLYESVLYLCVYQDMDIMCLDMGKM